MNPALIDHSKIQKYIQRFISSILGVDIAFDKIDPLLAETCFAELSRLEEAEITWRDQWGNWEWPFCEAQREGQLYSPRIDEQLAVLRRQLLTETNKNPVALWPDSKDFALCLTHDVDEVNEPSSIKCGLRRADLYRRSGEKWTTVVKTAARTIIDSLSSNQTNKDASRRTLDDWLGLEDQHGFKSTFFITAGVPVRPSRWDCTYRFDDKVSFKANRLTLGEALCEIDRLGWEIGLHGSYLSATEPDLLQNEKQRLEKVLDKPIESVRQHYLHYQVETTPGLQAQAGLLIDSTIGFNRAIGFRSGTAFPHQCWDHHRNCPLSILEVPLIIMDNALFLSNSLEYDYNLALNHCLRIMETVAKVGGCLTINWHHDYLNDDLYWQSYRALLDEAARRNAWGCNLRTLRQWWSSRERNISSQEGIGKTLP